MRVEMLRRRLDGFATSISRLVFQFEVGNVLTRPMMLEKFHRILAIFAMRKASVESNPRWPLLRAMRPVAEWRSLLFNWHGATSDPSSREAYCRAAVSPQPSCMPLKCSCALWAGAVWGQGVLSLVRAMRPIAEWRSFLFN